MDGLFLSYHNTEKTFGFEYLPFEIVEKIIFGNKEKANMNFLLSGKISTAIFDQLKSYFKDFSYQKMLLGFYANGITDTLVIFAELFEKEEFDQFANQNLVR